MEIKKSAVVGTLESKWHHDHFIKYRWSRIDIQLESSVEKQFGNQINQISWVEEAFKQLGVAS